MSLDCIPVGEHDTDLYYQTVGEGPPITFVHGFSGNHLTWWQQLPAFAGDYRCLAPDQRRFGLSEDTGGTGVGAFADDLADLLDALGVERTALVGHSMGGWTVASFATQYPDRVAALVLSATPGGLLSPERHADLVADAGDRPDADAMTPEATFLSEAIADLNRDAPAEWTDVRPTLDELPLDRDRIVKADIPTLLVAGEGDEFMPPTAVDDLADRLWADAATVEGAGHSIHFEKPTAFNRLVREFVDEQAEF